MKASDVADQQSAILKSIYDSVEVDCKEPDESILHDIKTISVEEAELLFGSAFGYELLKFALDVDTSHPEISKMFDGQLVGDKLSSFSREAIDVIKIYKYIKSEKLSRWLIGSATAMIKDHYHYKCISENAMSYLHARLIKNPAERRLIREKKGFQTIGVTGYGYAKKNFWESCPDDLIEYSRGKDVFFKHLEKAVERKNQLLDHGLEHMAEEIEKSIVALKNMSLESTYYGFNKVSLVETAVALANMCGYSFIETENLSCSPKIFKTLGSFGGYDFYDKSLPEHSGILFDTIDFQPRVYTHIELEDCVSKEITDVISFLESFPQAGGKPLFDHYRIVVPGVDYPHKSQAAPFRFIDPDGSRVKYGNVNVAKKMLDITLLNNKCIIGALLGERDGEHFFICYWI